MTKAKLAHGRASQGMEIGCAYDNFDSDYRDESRPGAPQSWTALASSHLPGWLAGVHGRRGQRAVASSSGLVRLPETADLDSRRSRPGTESGPERRCARE